MSKRKNLLLFSLGAETFLASFGLLIGQQTAIISLLYIVAVGVFMYSITGLPDARLRGIRELKNEYLPKFLLLALMVSVAIVISRFWFYEIPLDPDFADMLPIMKVMNERFIHGNFREVYDPIPEIWNGTLPIYLTAMWLPYAPAIALHADMRWISVIAVLMSVSVILIFIRLRKNAYFGYGMLLITAALFWWIFARNDIHSLITMSEEGVVIFYFVLLTTAVISGNAFFIGITASLCLLSRYSMIGWVLPYIIYLGARKEFRKLIIFCCTGAACFLFLFLIPFGFGTLERMLELPGNYVAFAKHVWEFSPEVYWLNLGMAKFYGPHHITSLHKTLLVASFTIPIVFMICCLLQKKGKLHNINLACLKLSLLVFYQFIDVPYGYLFYPSVFVSIVIAAVLLDGSRVTVGR